MPSNNPTGKNQYSKGAKKPKKAAAYNGKFSAAKRKGKPDEPPGGFRRFSMGPKDFMRGTKF